MFFFSLTACLILLGSGVMLTMNNQVVVGVVLIVAGIIYLGSLIYYYSKKKRREDLLETCRDCGCNVGEELICSEIPFNMTKSRKFFGDCDCDCPGDSCGCSP